MSDSSEPRIPFWAKGVFFLGDALLLLVGLLIVMESPRPMPWNHLALLVGCVATAGILGAIPFWLEYQASVRLAESHGLQSSLMQIQRLEEVGEHVKQATGQWQSVQEHCNRAVKSVQEITDQMVKEGKAF